MDRINVPFLEVLNMRSHYKHLVGTFSIRVLDRAKYTRRVRARDEDEHEQGRWHTNAKAYTDPFEPSEHIADN